MNLKIEKIVAEVTESRLTSLLQNALHGQTLDTAIVTDQLGELRLHINAFQLVGLDLKPGAIQAQVSAQLKLSGDKVICDASFSTQVELRPRLKRGKLDVEVGIEELRLDDLEEAKWRFLPIPKLVLRALLKGARTRLEESLITVVNTSLEKEQLTGLLQKFLLESMPATVGLGNMLVAFLRLSIESERIVLIAEVQATILEEKGIRSQIEFPDKEVLPEKILLTLPFTELTRLLNENLEAINKMIHFDGIELSRIGVQEQTGELWITLHTSGEINQIFEMGAQVVFDPLKQELHLENLSIPTAGSKGLLGKAMVVAFRGKVKKLVSDLSPIDVGALVEQGKKQLGDMAEPSFQLLLEGGGVDQLLLATGEIRILATGLLRVQAK